MVFKDHHSDPLVPVGFPIVLGFNDIDEQRAAVLFLEVEEISPFTASNLSAVNLLGSDGNHPP